MRARTTLAGMVLCGALTTALSEGAASAQTRAPQRDLTRVRYGIALEGGGLFAPGVVDLGTLGLQGQLGVQFNHLVGVYAATSVDAVSGWHERGLAVGGALLVDFTLGHVFTVGLGPDLGGFVAMGGGSFSGGLLYGMRLHLAVNPLVHLQRRDGRRKALVLGLDLRLGGDGGAGVLSTRRVAAGELVTAPTLTIGYQAF